MRRSSVVFLLVPFLAAAQQSANQSKPVQHYENGAIGMPDERAADSYAIYSMLAPGPVLEHMPPGQTQTWAIADTTISTSDRNPVPPQGQLKPPPRPNRKKAFEEAVADFEANQYLRIHLTRDGFHLEHPFALLTPEQVQQLRDAKSSPAASSSQAEWSGYPGITFFSEVYFDTHHSIALVYRSEWCAHLCSAGSWIYLERRPGNPSHWVQQSGIVVPGA